MLRAFNPPRPGTIHLRLSLKDYDLPETLRPFGLGGYGRRLKVVHASLANDPFIVRRVLLAHTRTLIKRERKTSYLGRQNVWCAALTLGAFKMQQFWESDCGLRNGRPIVRFSFGVTSGVRPSLLNLVGKSI